MCVPPNTERKSVSSDASALPYKESPQMTAKHAHVHHARKKQQEDAHRQRQVYLKVFCCMDHRSDFLSSPAVCNFFTDKGVSRKVSEASN